MSELPLSALFAQLQPSADSSAALEARLAAAVASGRAAWPGVALAAEGFVRWLAERAVDGDLDSLRTDELYLACACSYGDVKAIEAFERRFLTGLERELRRFADSSEFVNEVLQQLRERLLTGPNARIRQFKGNGSLEGWVRTAAVRLATNSLRDSQVDRRALRGVARQVPTPDDPELEHIKLRYGAAVETALGRALETLAAERRYLLRLHYVDGLALDKIGALHRANKSTISRWLAASRQELLKETKRILASELGLAVDALDSLIGVVASRLDLSLSRLMAP
jgi:RNA polymerase sigma-70 factor (ECF subfamily)